ncbi:N-lysine methyltransferase KMT5A-A-like [Astyanax mexicanus]|uniref:N-lysine methyltransferase KMT5A-A-like n=1 Tax=Astyanax mexicanus TaxID=7994 RepID=UPI0020CAE16C|nr:N-lysine methyltransferase KMT5A-A-like [Astyanax mexicanus]
MLPNEGAAFEGNDYLGSSLQIGPQLLVRTPALLNSLSLPYSGETAETRRSTVEPVPPPRAPDTKDFSEFLVAFPVSTSGQPPTKKARMQQGFPDDRMFYDKWRCEQYRMRQDSLLSCFTHRKPTVGKVSRAIQKEGWTANYPSPDTVLQLWKPASQAAAEKDPAILESVVSQTWRGLAIKDFGPGKGLGVVATRPFSKGDIVCDYHGKIITAEKGRKLMQSMVDEAGYMFFFKAGGRDLCIDAQTFPCKCHPHADTIGRRMNHSRKNPNVKPMHCTLLVDGEDKDVILFRALKDIPVDTELKFDYGVNRKSFRGEGLELD